ncbi:MAG: hypothetical protein KN64_09965 [Sulfurovum sp. AS07-7]|nr:MAG: hypothetical protein KN64_09965 [Sulfurovum sp. AS07-7]
MKLLFFALTKHQYHYFKILKQNLSYNSKVIFFPSLSISMEGLRIIRQLDLSDILVIKHKEIDAKYQGFIHKFLYKKLLSWQIPFVGMVVYKALKENPDFLILWNGKKFHQAIAVKMAQIMNIKCAFFENGVLPNTTTLDFKGVNASNSLPRNYQFYQQLDYQKQALPSTLERRVSKKEKIVFETSLPNNYIFVPFQVAYDTQIIQHTPWIKDMFEFFTLIENLSKKLEIAFVIKEHPSDRVSDYRSLHQKQSDKIIFSTESTQILIENAQAILTINSSVAIESLLFNKKVIVLGEAFFAIDKIVKIANSQEVIFDILKNLQSWEVEKDVIKKFLLYLYVDYLIADSWKNPTQRHFTMIENKFLEQK